MNFYFAKLRNFEIFCQTPEIEYLLVGNQATVSFLTDLARAAFGLGAASTAFNFSLYTVNGGQRAVFFDRFYGILDETVGEGSHFLISWVQKPYIFNIAPPSLATRICKW